MKYLFILIVAFIGCNPKDKPVDEKQEVGKILTPSELQVIEGGETARGKKPKTTTHVTVSNATTVTLTHTGGNSFSIDYGGATDVIWMFFRWGSALAANGNVDPYSPGSASQSFYLNPVTTFTANGSGTYYQAVVITGSLTPDANGVVGAGWVVNYSNVVQ